MLQPCAVIDFMDYLVYVEHAAENLQFYLWYHNYTRRFTSLSESQRMLSPQWTTGQRKDAERRVTGQRIKDSKLIFPAVVAIPELQEDIPKANNEIPCCLTPFATPPNRAHTHRGSYSHPQQCLTGWNANSKALESPEAVNETAASAFENANYFQPCMFPFFTLRISIPSNDMRVLVTVQPFRKEINRIVAIYMVDGGPRQLNLTSWERNILIQALTVTTHPSAFRGVIEEVEWNLRQQSYPHFIQWTMNSTNRQRLLCSRIGSSFLVILGLIAGILPILSTANRSWRILSAVILLPALSCFIAALDGSCIVSSQNYNLTIWNIKREAVWGWKSYIHTNTICTSFFFASTDGRYTHGSCS